MKCGIPAHHLFIETSWLDVLYEVGLEHFPLMQDDHLDQPEETKTRALLGEIAVRVKGGEDLWHQNMIDSSLVGHLQLYCPDGINVYELCQNGDGFAHIGLSLRVKGCLGVCRFNAQRGVSRKLPDS